MIRPLCLSLFALSTVAAHSETIFVEAESLANPGGWTLDTQFIEIMGSPYLLAHGLGTPVADAKGKIEVKAKGTYRVWARTKDWVAHWKAPGAPGKFKLALNGTALANTLGTEGAEWHWQLAGTTTLSAGSTEISLHDMTGFNGRCDAIILSSDANFTPPNEKEALATFRRKALNLPAVAPETPVYDLVVTGGGYAGMGAAISAARQGLKVALIQNRPVLGGNGSSEVRVWAMGGTQRGLYPHLGDIIEEFADKAKNSPGVAEQFGDDKKEAAVRAEKNIDLMLSTHVVGVKMEPGSTKKISGVIALDVRTGAEKNVRGKFFCDSTGHGTLGALAGAEFTMLETGHMGMSNMWYYSDAEAPVKFPTVEWALPLTVEDFPATKKAEGSVSFYKGEWFWEGGFNKHPLNELEYVRDWNLRAVFGAFYALKNGPDAEKNAKAKLDWVAAIGGTRESRLLQGDIVLTDKDIVEQREFPDACVPTTWDLDLHYPKEQYAKKFPDAPFISKAVFGKGVDRKNGYPVPYRCFYSKDVENMFMAGRCLSVTHEALGTVRVMKTCGMMGEVVGKAAYLCVAKNSTPRGVYQSYLGELKELFQQPGAARRETIDGPLVTPPGVTKRVAGQPVPFKSDLPGIVIDDTQAKLSGKWSEGTGLHGFIGSGYHYSSDNAATATYNFTVPTTGEYEVRISWQPHENRSAAVACDITPGGSVVLNQREAPKGTDAAKGFTTVGKYRFTAGQESSVVIKANGAKGNVHADAVWIVEAGK